MTNSTPEVVATASMRELALGTLIAAAIAAVILAIAVLPAEYGIDPTGIGKALGLTALHNTSGTEAKNSENAIVAAPVATPATTPTVGAPATITSKQVTPYRADTQKITLQPGEGLEYKTRLQKGAALIYSWKTQQGEKIHHEFHGEPQNAKPDVYESYLNEAHVSESSGSLIAPFAGTHGWYWENKNSTPVTLTLNASGFYAELYKN